MKNRKKVLFVITKSNWGGAQKYVYDLATSLPKERFEVKVALGGEGSLAEKLREAGMEIIPIKTLQRDIEVTKEFATFFELLKIFCEEKPDVVHLNSSKVGGLGALAGRLAGVKKIIFTAHGWAFNENRNFISKILIKILYWFTIILSHQTIAVSKETARQIKNFPFIGKEISVIYNGMSEPIFKGREESREFLAQKNIELKKIDRYQDKVWLGAISELHHIKGLNYAIDAFKKISAGAENKNIIFVILGEGEERTRLETQIKNNNLENRIFLLGHVPDASTFLKAFDIFTLTSLSEALPYTPIEAGFASLPVIATNVGGISEIIENNESGLLIPSRDSSAVAAAFQRLFTDRNLSYKLGQNLRQKVTAKFSKEKMLAETLKIYLYGLR